MPTSPLAALCTRDNFVRNTLFSDTFRAPIILNGDVPLLYDIERIQVPFNQTRESYIRTRYGLSQRDMVDYYRYFSRSLRNGLSLISRIASDKSNERAAATIAQYTYQSVDKHDQGDGYDVYLVSTPTTRFFDSDLCKDGRVSFQAAVNLAIRLLVSMHALHETNIYVGAIDPNMVVLSPPVNGKTKGYIVFTSLFHARDMSKGSSFQYAQILPPYAHPSLAEGAQPSESTDTYSVAALLAAIFNGTAGTEHPSFTIDDSTIPEQLLTSIEDALECKNTAKEFANALRLVKKENIWFRKGEDGIYFPVYQKQPDFLAPAPTPQEPASVDEEQKTDDTETAPEPDSPHEDPTPDKTPEPSEEPEPDTESTDTTTPADENADANEPLELLEGTYVLEDDNEDDTMFPEELR